MSACNCRKQPFLLFKSQTTKIQFLKIYQKVCLHSLLPKIIYRNVERAGPLLLKFSPENQFLFDCSPSVQFLNWEWHFCRGSYLNWCSDGVNPKTTTGEFLPGQAPPPDSARNWPRTWRLSDWRVCRPGRRVVGLVPTLTSDPFLVVGQMEESWSGACLRVLRPVGILLW